MQRVFKFQWLMWCFLLLPTLLLAQGVTTATITGSVLDTKGQALPGANVVAVHNPSGTTFGAATRADGGFVIPGVRVGGPYTVSVTFIGYKKETRENIYLTLGEVRRLDFRLTEEAVEVGEVQVVAERNPIFSEARTGASTYISTQQIQSLPTIQRMISDFARLTPQVVGRDLGRGGEQLGGYNVGSKNARYNNVQVDGAVLNDVFGLPESGAPGGQANAQPISIDAIQEFQVSIAPYDVKQGNFTGGLINAITRSGANRFEGSGYFFGRNQDFVNDKLAGQSSPLPDFGELQTGFRLGGPLKENKLFFFVSGELKRRNDPREVGFAGSVSPNIFNVPQDSVQKIINIAKKYGYNAGEFGKYTADTDDNKLFARLDYNISNRHRLTLRHNFVDANLDRGILRDQQTFALTSQEYIFNSVQNSTVAQLNSTMGINMANEARVTYTRIRDKRDPTANPFPQVRVTVGPSQNVFLGVERFSQANALDQDIFEFTDNLSYFRGNHTFTLGTHNEFIKYRNLFIQDFYGAYEFGSITDFNNGRPSRYYYSYSLTSDPKQAAKWNSAQFGLYAQDEWKAKPNLNLTLGLRVDIPLFLDDPLRNPTFEKAFPGRRTDEVPSGNLLWSPRLGFNWDVSKNRTTQLRGGVGIFSGRTPGVWLSNQYSNTGVDFARIDVRGTSTPNFSPDPNNQPKNLTPVATTEVNLTDTNFKFPQVLRTNLAVDRQIYGGLVGTLELIYSKNVNDILYQNINYARTGKFAFDGRPQFAKVSSNFTNILLLSSSDQGYQYFITAQVQKQLGQGFLRDLAGSVAYTFNRASDVNSGTSSRAISNWQNNLIPGDPNNPPETISNFEVRHRIVGTLSYRFNYFEKFATNVSLFYEGRSGRPFSYNYNGDANGDGSSVNDLVYVPKDGNDIILTTNNWADLDAFIKADEALNSQRGKIFERNSAREPWINELDVRIAQEVPSISGHRVELTMDILNVLNLLNSDWGKQEYAPFPGYQLLGFSGYDAATGKPKVSFSKRTTKFNIDNLLSRWAIQLGARYSF